jgi:hypothetical protein
MFAMREKGAASKDDSRHGKISWINKEFEDMNDMEVRSMAVLSQLEDYMTTHHLRARDIFGAFDSSGDGNVDALEFSKGIQKVYSENGLGFIAQAEDLLFTMKLIDADSSGCLDFLEVDSVIKTVQDRKARHKNKNNPFIKEPGKMNTAEQAANAFFIPLHKELQARGWTAEDFFKHYDTESGEKLSLRGLLKAGKELCGFGDIPNFEKGIMTVDPNFDGHLTVKELHMIQTFIKHANSMRDAVMREATNPFLRELREKNSRSTESDVVRVFGLKAFIESCLKIGMGFLSFHGTPEQSELPTQAKVVWFMTYLNWQFATQRAAAKAQATKWRHCTTRLGRRKSLHSEVMAIQSKGYNKVDIAQEAPEEEEEIPETEQKESRGTKVALVVTAAVASKKEEGKERFQNPHTGRYDDASNSAPLYRLMTQREKLFQDTDPPPSIGGVSMARSGPCTVCKHLPTGG